VIAEVRRVIPHVKQRRDWLPRNDVIAELLILRRGTTFQRMREATFDRTKAHDDVLSWADGLGRLARVLIGQRVYADIVMVLLNRLGHSIHEFQQRTCRTAFRVINGFALVTLTIFDHVILRYADDSRIRMLFDPLLDTPDGNLQHIWI